MRQIYTRKITVEEGIFVNSFGAAIKGLQLKEHFSDQT
jgi:hypothetical protein